MWITEILPEWETSKKWRKTREIWWQGLPPCVRGQVWKLSIGNDLNVTADLYNMCLERAKDKLAHSQGVGLEDSVDAIKLDLSRTFPHLAIFQHGGPFHQVLGDLLSAYVCFRPDIGYVQVPHHTEYSRIFYFLHQVAHSVYFMLSFVHIS